MCIGKKKDVFALQRRQSGRNNHLFELRENRNQHWDSQLTHMEGSMLTNYLLRNTKEIVEF